VKYSFVSPDGKVPVGEGGKVAWVADKARAVREGKDWGMSGLAVLEDDGSLIEVIPLDEFAFDEAGDLVRIGLNSDR